MKAALTFIAVLTLIVFLAAQPVAWASPSSWSQVADETSKILDDSFQVYLSGRPDEAIKTVDKAYLGPFESQGMEAAIRLSISGQRAFEFEEKFRQIKRSYAANDPAKATAALTALKQMLRDDAGKLDGAGNNSSALFLSSFLIILREGFEAILVISALVAYMVKSGNQRKVRTIYSAAAMALLASVAFAYIFSSLVGASGAAQEVIEGATMLLAAAVLFLVSFWLLSKAQAGAWQRYIDSKVKDSLSRGNVIALWSAAFLAVFREGAETVLFYSALAGGAKETAAKSSLVGGFILGSVALAAVYLVIRLGSVKIPMRAFFTVTGNFLYLLAFIFAGGGVNELQSAGMIGSTPINGLPAIASLGIYPTWQTLSAQMLLVVLYVAGMFYQRRINQASPLKARPAD